MSNKDPGIHVGPSREKGVKGIVGTSSNRGENESKNREQNKEAMERKWRDILRENKELDKSMEKGEGEGEKQVKRKEPVENEKIEISKVIVGGIGE